MTTGPAPGWYPDPINPEIHRWFDGVNLIDSVRPSSHAASQPPASDATEQYPAANWAPEPAHVNELNPPGVVPAQGMPPGPGPEERAWYRKKRWWGLSAITLIVLI